MALPSAPGALPRRAENLGCVMCSLGLTRMGLRHSLSTFLGAHRYAQPLDASLQLASPAPRNRPRRADQPPGSVQKQPLGTSQLGLGFVANQFDVVPVRTNDKSCIVVRVVVRAQTRRSIVFAARLQSRAIER